VENGLAGINREWIGKPETVDSPQRVVLDRPLVATIGDVSRKSAQRQRLQPIGEIS
jgi:hypothetical protein